MTCKELVDFLADYLENELSGEVRGEFQRHLNECPECVAYMQGYERTVRLGQGVFCHPDDPVPSEVPDGLVRAILAASRKKA
jgi:anti-sigma factor RsiW